MQYRLPAGMIHQRQILVGQLWLRGYSQRQITELIRQEAQKPGSPIALCHSTSRTSVQGDIKKCRAGWVERDLQALSDQRSIQVSRILDIVHQCWADFSNPAISKGLRPQYLHTALAAEKELSKILGTLAPVKIAGPEGEPILPPIVNMHFPDGVVLQAPQNGHEPAEVTTSDNGDGSD
jgi:hypothetical protein